MAKPGKAAPEEKEAEAPAKPKSKRLVLAVLGIVILGAVGGGAWYLLKGSKHEEPKPAVVEVPVFVKLEPFTVNLQRDEGGTDQFLQLEITLKVSGPKMEEEIKQRLPEVRSRLLFLLSSKHPSELVPVEGKKKLAREIAAEANAALGLHDASHKNHESNAMNAASEVGAAASAPAEGTPAPAPAANNETAGKGVLDVLFTSFIIQ